jgi:penicillin-binding protein 1A
VLGVTRTRRDRRVQVAAAVAVLGMAGVSGAWWQTCGFEACPSAVALREWRPRAGDVVRAHDGALLGMIDPVRRVPIALADVPTHVREAFIAVEDRRFREHAGVDWRGVVRATFANVRAGGVREGASTITMQLARNAFLTDEVRGWKRKALEVRYAQLLERALDKDEILERYLNTIYFGNGTWGVEAAALDLLGSSVRKANLADAALLAGLPKAPSSYNPRRSASRATARRDVVLGVLVDAGLMTTETAARARARPVRVPARAWRPDWPAHTWAVDVARGTLDSLMLAGVLPPDARTRDLVVHTTIDARAQRQAERAVAAGARRVDAARADARAHPTQGALVALDPGTGAVRAVAGGRSVDARGFNRALHARRQVGSTFKPFVFAAAMERGVAPNRLLSDDPLTLRTGRTVWTPTNFADRHDGRLTLRRALVRSNNIATVRLAQDVGNDAVIDVARRTGVHHALPDVPSLALGSASLTPLELTAAYAAFANGGWRVEPHVITRVERADGTLLWERAPSTRERALAVEDAFLVTSMLESAVNEGTGRAVRELGVQGPVAGKTGTTNDGADAWFVGYTPSLVAAVWLGTDAPRSLGAAASGGRYAAPVWAQFVRDGWRVPPGERGWNAPPSLLRRTIDAETGQLFGDWCSGEPAVEWFKPGTEPTSSCEGGWFRWARGRDEALTDAVYDAAVGAIGEAIGEGRVRQSLLRRLANEFRRTPEPPRPPRAPEPRAPHER